MPHYNKKTKIPLHKYDTAAKHAFFYLVSFLSLGFVAYNVGALFFEIINHYFPAELESWRNTLSQSNLKFSLASLITTAPVFFIITQLINSNLITARFNFESGIRKWITYIALFITTGFIIGDLISTIFNFLDGELTIRFFLKALTIFVIAGAIFYYYLTDIKSEKAHEKNQLWNMVFWGLVLIPFVWSLFLVESPKIARMKKLDQQIIDVIDDLQIEIYEFQKSYSRLPKSLKEVEKSTGKQKNGYVKKMITDYQIRYRQTSEEKYQLCAKFTRANQRDKENERQYTHGSEWLHGAGNHCFDLSTLKEDKIIRIPQDILYE